MLTVPEIEALKKSALRTRRNILIGDIMLELDKEYPMYDFKKNKGYGTKTHLLALEKYGVTKHHRMSYAPVYEASMPRFDI